MGFYDLPKNERQLLIEKIREDLMNNIETGKFDSFTKYFSDTDTYIRKAAYQACGYLFMKDYSLGEKLISHLNNLYISENPKIRQTVINAGGEIACYDFNRTSNLLEKGLFDDHHSVRNAVIGSLKKTGKVWPEDTINFAYRFLHHENKEVRRQIIHGLELRGRTNPEDILPLLIELEYEKTSRVRKMIIHVAGQISYKKGCLPKILDHLKIWKNEKIVAEILKEIVIVHHNYKDFSHLTPEQAEEMIISEKIS